MIDENISQAVAGFAVNLETDGDSRDALSDCPEYSELPANEKKEFLTLVSRILIGFLCAETSAQQAILAVGAADGNLDPQVLETYLDRQLARATR